MQIFDSTVAEKLVNGVILGTKANGLALYHPIIVYTFLENILDNYYLTHYQEMRSIIGLCSGFSQYIYSKCAEDSCDPVITEITIAVVTYN